MHDTKADGSIEVAPAEHCSGVQANYQISNGKPSVDDIYTCDFEDLGSCQLRNTGTWRFTSASEATGSLTVQYICSGVTATDTITGTA